MPKLSVCEKIHPMTTEEIDALIFWRKPIEDALQGDTIRVIDTENILHNFPIKVGGMNSGPEQSSMSYGFGILQNGEARCRYSKARLQWKRRYRYRIVGCCRFCGIFLLCVRIISSVLVVQAVAAQVCLPFVTFAKMDHMIHCTFSQPSTYVQRRSQKPWIDIRRENHPATSWYGCTSNLSEREIKQFGCYSAIEFLDEHLQPFSAFWKSLKL